jgi:8-amino-7-oxononanoate synthase
MSRSEFDDLLRFRLARLDSAGHLRLRAEDLRARATAAASRLGRAAIDLSSNDYLSFAQLPLRPLEGAPGGAGSSRLIHGTRAAHAAAERALAEWVGQEDALLFASGYAANVGVVSALAQPGDLILSDALNHASLIDGCRLSRAEVLTFPHRDLGALERLLDRGLPKTTWVLTESYFSMDGTAPDLAALGKLLAARPGAHLIVDEAHALGVYGPKGAGLCVDAGVLPVATVGTFGKALGLHGAFVAGPSALCDWLWNRARAFVYSTAPSPALVSAVAGRVQDVRGADGTRQHLHDLCRMFHVKLRSVLPNQYPEGSLPGPIVPLLAGGEHAALAIRNQLLHAGILTQAIRPPTVPAGTSRLRLTLHAGLSLSDLDYVLQHLEAAFAAAANTL